jgi:hypothetical protein
MLEYLGDKGRESMIEHERRSYDGRLDEIAEKLDKLVDIMQGENGILVTVREVKTKGESCQKELTEHKTSHWQFTGVVVGAVGAIIAGFEWLRGK